MSVLLNEHKQWLDGNLPIVNGKVFVGTQGNNPTTGYPDAPVNLITIYSDRELTTPITNPQPTDADGRTVNKIWIPGTEYSLVVWDSDGVQKYIELDVGFAGFEGLSPSQFLRSDVSDTFNAQDFLHTNALPRHSWIEADVNVDQSTWSLLANGERFGGFIYSDDFLNNYEWLTIQRSGLGAGITVDSIDLTATAVNLNGNTEVSGTVNFLNNFHIRGVAPNINIWETDATANNIRWRIQAANEKFLGELLSDAGSAVEFLAVERTLNVVDSIDLTATAINLNGEFSIEDGITAPSTVSGRAFIYVDTADGDLKVKFGDGTVKTLATDT